MKKEKEPVAYLEEPVKDEYDPSEEMPYKLEHFKIFNKWARKNKVPVRVPSGDLYPKMKVRFQRFEQPQNVLKCRIRNDEIDWSGQLIPGCIYELPIPVIKWLTSLSEPVFAEVRMRNDAGGGRYIEKTETKQVGERARFTCMPVDLML